MEGAAMGAAREVEEEEELDEAGGGGEGATAGGAGTVAGGTTVAEEGQPDNVRSEAEETERSPRVKERSGETAGGTVEDTTDAGP